MATFVPINRLNFVSDSSYFLSRFIRSKTILSNYKSSFTIVNETIIKKVTELRWK